MARSVTEIFSQTTKDLSDQNKSKVKSHSSRSSDTNQSLIFNNNDEEIQPGRVEFLRINANHDDINQMDAASIDEISISQVSGSSIQNSSSEYLDREREEELSMAALKKKVRHIFIVSANGKPVFSRYGDEEHMVTLMGVMQTLVSFTKITDSGDLYYLKAGPARVAFLRREPFVFVIVCHTNESYLSLVQELHCVYDQIISTLTLTRIQQRYKSQPNFDLRRWFSQAEKKLIHNLLDLYEHDLGLFMKSVRCLPLSQKVRDQIGHCIFEILRTQQDLPFIILLIQNQLVSIVRMKGCHLQPSDLYLLINLVECSDKFAQTEAWIPLCLPRFDPGGTLHAHISYLDDQCQISLILLTINPEAFFKVSNFKQQIAQKLNEQNFISQIIQSFEETSLLQEEIHLAGLRYFIYKNLENSQIVSSKLVHPYVESDEQVRLFEQIRCLYTRFHQNSYPLKEIISSTGFERIYACVTETYELYGVFDRSFSSKNLLKSIEKILSFIIKNERNLFIFHCECLS